MKFSPFSKFSPFCLIAVMVAACFQGTAGYDIGCIYPQSMPDPIEARERIIELLIVLAQSLKMETPIVIQRATAFGVCGANCLAYHDDQVLNTLTRQRPIIEVPTQYHNSFSRMLCMLQCYEIVAFPFPKIFHPYFRLWGVDGIQSVRPDVQTALMDASAGDTSALQELLVKEDFHPFLIGQIVGIEVATAFVNDGWNSLGQLTYDTETGKALPCTANCENFGDTTGYYPRNFATGKPENSTTKYIVEGNDKHWQPLYEDDGNGYFTIQRHVTPHIGFTATPHLFDSVEDIPETPDPEYNFYEEALLVVERVRETASDSLKKQKIELYDDKLLVRGLIQDEMRNQFTSSYSFEDELLFINGISAGEYDAVLMAWREKVRHDLVRPTTVIKRWGSDVLETFGGDKSMEAPINISARDFQAFQRVMPHSEYPSGSACLCTAYAEFTDAFTKEYYGKTLVDLTYGKNGFSIGCGDQGEYPPYSKTSGCTSDVVIPDMTTLMHECGQSRLWAGVHFTAAVSAAEELCAGLGEKNIAFEKLIRNGSTLGTKYYQGGERPQCGTGPAGSVNVQKEGGDGGQRNTNTESTKDVSTKDESILEIGGSGAGMFGESASVLAGVALLLSFLV